MERVDGAGGEERGLEGAADLLHNERAGALAHARLGPVAVGMEVGGGSGISGLSRRQGEQRKGKHAVWGNYVHGDDLVPGGVDERDGVVRLAAGLLGVERRHHALRECHHVAAVLCG